MKNNRVVVTIEMNFLEDRSAGIYGGVAMIEAREIDGNVDISDLPQFLEEALQEYTDGGSVTVRQEIEGVTE